MDNCTTNVDGTFGGGGKMNQIYTTKYVRNKSADDQRKKISNFLSFVFGSKEDDGRIYAFYVNFRGRSLALENKHS